MEENVLTLLGFRDIIYIRSRERKGLDKIKPCKGTSWNWVRLPALPPNTKKFLLTRLQICDIMLLEVREMRITRLKDIDELNELRDKLEAVFSKEFTDKEKVAMLDLAENSDELFWEIMFEAIEKS